MFNIPFIPFFLVHRVYLLDMEATGNYPFWSMVHGELVFPQDVISMCFQKYFSGLRVSAPTCEACRFKL